MALTFVYITIAFVVGILLAATAYAIITTLFGKEEPKRFEDTEWSEQSTPMEWYVGNGFRMHASKKEDDNDSGS